MKNLNKFKIILRFSLLPYAVLLLTLIVNGFTDDRLLDLDWYYQHGYDFLFYDFSIFIITLFICIVYQIVYFARLRPKERMETIDNNSQNIPYRPSVKTILNILYRLSTKAILLIIVFITSIFYFWTRFWRFSVGFICPLYDYDSFSDIGIIIVLAISFTTAFILGIKNVRYKWLYPFFTSAFIWIIPSLIYLMLEIQVDGYIFSYYLIYAFIFIFLGQLIVALIGLGLGLLTFKIYRKVRASKEKYTP